MQPIDFTTKVPTMRFIKTYSVGHAQELVIDLISKWGKKVTTEENEVTLQIEPLCIQIDTPMSEPRRSPCTSYQEVFMEEYTDKVINGYKESNFTYDYHSRLCDRVDQIDYMVKKIIETPTTRRAIATTWIPEEDELEPYCPCLQYIQLIRDGNKLDMFVLFRSNDMLSAFGCNAYALTKLLDVLAERCGCTVGTYTHVAVVPHIYIERDKSELERYNVRSN